MNTENISVSPPDQKALKTVYDKYAEIRFNIANDIKEYLEQILVSIHSNPVVSVRIKNFDSFFSKYLRLLKSGDKNPKITDLMGVRIICPFLEDLGKTEKLIEKNFVIQETENKGHRSFKEFVYESTHILVKIPPHIIEKHGYPEIDIAEIQIRTILQDAWAEVEHELIYKAEFNPFDEPMKRKLAAVNANLTLADIIFQELRTYQQHYSQELLKRRESFYQKIEESTDNLLFAEKENKKGESAESLSENLFTDSLISGDYETTTIDDLLVNALAAHNQNRFNEAIKQYNKILELNPDEVICSIIYKHLGMANFACSNYENAIQDFSSALELDTNSYKAAYYRGVVNSVLKQYSPAIDDYTLSLSINPYQSFCLFRRAQAFYHIGDYPQALSDCENSLSLEPNNKSAEKLKMLLLEKLRM